MAIAGRRIHLLVRLFTRITLTGRRWIADDNQIAMVELRVQSIAIPSRVALIKLKGGIYHVQLNRRAQIVAMLRKTIVPLTDLDMLL